MTNPAPIPNYVPDVNIDAIMNALQAFIQIFMPVNCQQNVVRAETNRVPLPPSPCVVLTELYETDLAIPYENFAGTSQITTITGRTKFDIQIDFYGEIAGDICKAVKQAWRTEWGWAQFPATVKPLYTDDGRQMPLTTGEDQYLRRWTLTASLQYNPAVTVPQQSATVLKPTVHTPADLPVT